MKAQKCKLIIHGGYMQHDLGEFESITKAKEYARDWNRPHTIIKIKS